MIRRVPKDKVELGMYLQAIDGPWMNHPFWRTKFLIADPADLQAIRESDINAVLIDDEKGKGFAEPLPEPIAIVAAPEDTSRGPRAAKEEVIPDGPCSASEEIHRATRILKRSKRAVARMFADVRMGKAVDLASLVPLVDEVSASVDRNASALISIARLRSKDEYTYVHSVAVAALMMNLARQLELADDVVREIGIAGLLHDVGKVATPNDVLNKPGKLTDQEFAIMRTHPVRGHETLKDVPDVPAIALDVCLHHHEKVDGSGYPEGLRGDAISLYARMASVCDVYDAMTSNRPYKEAWGAAESLANMYRWKGHFDERILNAFIRSVGIYPVGSLVRLRSDRLGLVIDQNAGDLTRPIVRVFYSIADDRPLALRDVDMAHCDAGDIIVSREDPAKWGLDPWEERWTDLIARKAAPARRGPEAAAA